MSRSAVVPLRGGPLVVFDPEVLSARRQSPARWMKEKAALEREIAEGRLLLVDVGKRPFVEVRLVEGDSSGAAAERRIQVASGSVFAGDLADLPSRSWGHRRWNLWDWLFAAFIAGVVPLLWWLLGFDPRLLWVVAGTSAFFLLMLVPISWAMFKGGMGFARRTGLPPVDRPAQLLELPRGTWAAEVRLPSADDGAVEIHLSPARPATGR